MQVYSEEDQVCLFNPDLWSGKTSPEHSAATKEKISESCLKKLRELRIKPPLFLDLRKESGQTAAVSWETGGQLLGEYMMHSFGECPKDAVESHLSQILSGGQLQKYYLSAKACQGILRRAKTRGKQLPEILYKTLMKQAGLSASKNEPDVMEGVKESSSNMIESEHCQPSTINQYCLNDQGGQQISVSENVSGTLRAEEHGHQPLVFEPGAASRVGGHVYDDGKAGTVRANAGDNQQAVVYGISAYESNAMKSSNPNSGIYKADTTRTLDNNGGNPACNQGGMIVLEGNGSRPSHKGDGYSESDVSYTLNATEHHAVCTNLGGGRTLHGK